MSHTSLLLSVGLPSVAGIRNGIIVKQISRLVLYHSLYNMSFEKNLVAQMVKNLPEM